MKNKYLLSVNTGFAVNRFTNLKNFSSFIGDFLNIRYVQLTSDFLMLNMNEKYISKYSNNLREALIKKKIKVNSTFTGSYTRLNHLSHPDKEHQDYWLKWFKRFFKISKKLGANYSGSHLGILGFDEKKTSGYFLNKRLIDNWSTLSEYAYKIGLKGILWEPMSVPREFGETISKTIKISKILNKNAKTKFGLCLDVAHGDETSSNPKNYDPYAWLEKCSTMSPVIHLKQKVKGQYNHLPFTKKNNKIGLIDNKKVIKILDKNNLHTQELSLELSFKERSVVEKNLKRQVLQSVNYWKEVV
jgi:sugar phosphate isomerase/epimerase